MQRRDGFTLVEMLVVISIIAVLAALTFPAVNAVIENGRQTTCLNNMRNIGQATASYTTRKKFFPGYLNRPVSGATNAPIVTWQVVLLPDIDRLEDFNKWSATPPAINPIMAQKIETYFCPSDNTVAGLTNALTSYVVNSGRQGNDLNNSKFEGICHNLTGNINDINRLRVGLTDITDGADVTVLASENIDAQFYVRFATAATPDNESLFGMVWGGGSLPINQNAGGRSITTINSDPAENIQFARPASRHPGIVMVVFAGSNTKSIDQNVNVNVWNQLMTPNGAKVGVTQALSEGDY